MSNWEWIDTGVEKRHVGFPPPADARRRAKVSTQPGDGAGRSSL